MDRAVAPFERLLGLETEYAFRFSSPVDFHPGNETLFHALRESISQVVATRPGNSAPGREQFFCENGGAFYYEFLPHCLQGGLIEGATPECRGPGQLLLYQKAQELLLREAMEGAEDALARRGVRGRIGLLKNSRDAEGHVYGSQENYETEMARGLPLLALRAGLFLLLPVLALTVVVTFLAILLILLLALVTFLVVLFFPSGRRWFERVSQDDRFIEDAAGRFQLWLSVISTWPVVAPASRLLELFAFRRVRRGMLSFLVSRPVWAGTGAVDPDGRFELSEKGGAVRRVLRRTILPEDRPIFDTGNFLKLICAPFNFQLSPILQAFRRRQRLQIGYGDSNRAQVAEFLKIGATALVVDMAEAGFLDGAPRLARPVEALHAVVADPALEAPLDLSGGGTTTALELQRFYLERARAYLRESKATSLEAEEVVRLWGEVLGALHSGDLGSLVGRVDWVTKRYLIESCGDEDDQDVLQTLALRYHELGDGYFDRLEDAGETAVLVSSEEARRAVRQPPEGTPAFLRGGLIRRQAGVDVPVVVSWSSAFVGRRLRGGKVIPFRRPRS